MMGAIDALGGRIGEVVLTLTFADREVEAVSLGAILVAA
jgi:hypothetical protein